jgi:hypothetical protein
MVSPSIDIPGMPFSYPSMSTDQIGVMYSPSGTEITPEGYLYSGYGELMFYIGPDRQAVAQRLRTLEDGHLPIVCYEVEHEGLLYRFVIFAASLHITWTRRPIASDLPSSYTAAVQSYKDEYAKRYRALNGDDR